MAGLLFSKKLSYMLYFLIFLICYILMIFICSTMIVGWYGITRGEIVHVEGGGVQKKGKIFKEWHFFWDRKKVVSLDEHHDGMEYVWPEWVRYPLSECLSCMSSVYGTLFYWGMVSLIGPHLMYLWAYHPLGAKIWGWVVFCICVSAMNPIIYKKTV